MRLRTLLVAAVVALLLGAYGLAETNVPTKATTSRLVHVTVYQNTALVTREVDVPEGDGPMELSVAPLPPQTIDGSLYSEGTDGLRILSTRFRQRPIQEDTREEVRKVIVDLKELELKRENLQAEQKTLQQNLAMIEKLENATTAKLTTLTERGMTNADQTLTLISHVATKRKEYQLALTKNQQEQKAITEEIEFDQRKQNDLSAGTSKVERDAVINLSKTNRAVGRLRLNYLVSAASWTPQYKFKSTTKDKDPISVEYLAAVRQQSGEDWTNIKISLSTAQPSLNASPPELRMLAMNLAPSTVPPMPGNPGRGVAASGATQSMSLPVMNSDSQGGREFAKDNLEKSKQYRAQAQSEFNANKNVDAANRMWNDSAALEQCVQLLATKEIEESEKKSVNYDETGEGPGIAYHLNAVLSLPSRQDEQIVEVAKIELQPDFYYKAIPVLSKHVYRVAKLGNTSKQTLLPGEATMYIDNDFVGRSRLPLVAAGEEFQVGFGVDPQIQVQRQLIDKNKSMQGANQILRYDYRILANSFKNGPVKLQVWDRLPIAETEVVGISMVKTTPEISKDPLYLREERPRNLLRWDVELAPKMNGEQALAINYEFKLELDKQMRIGSFVTK